MSLQCWMSLQIGVAPALRSEFTALLHGIAASRLCACAQQPTVRAAGILPHIAAATNSRAPIPRRNFEFPPPPSAPPHHAKIDESGKTGRKFTCSKAANDLCPRVVQI